MNSYERVQCCLSHQPADRLPVDGYFRPEVWRKLADMFGASDHEQIRRELGIDFRQLEMKPTAAFRAFGAWRAWSPCARRRPSTFSGFDCHDATPTRLPDCL